MQQSESLRCPVSARSWPGRMPSHPWTLRTAPGNPYGHPKASPWHSRLPPRTSQSARPGMNPSQPRPTAHLTTTYTTAAHKRTSRRPLSRHRSILHRPFRHHGGRLPVEQTRHRQLKPGTEVHRHGFSQSHDRRGMNISTVKHPRLPSRPLQPSRTAISSSSRTPMHLPSSSSMNPNPACLQSSSPMSRRVGLPVPPTHISLCIPSVC